MSAHRIQNLLRNKFIFTFNKKCFGVSTLGKEIEFDNEKEEDSITLERNSGTGKMTML